MTNTTPDATENPEPTSDATPAQGAPDTTGRPEGAIDEAPAADSGTEAEVPSTDELEEPSTEKSPDEEPKAPAPDDAEPSHQATGIGVIDED